MYQALSRSTLHVCPERGTIAPCPAPHGITPTHYASAPARAIELINGTNNRTLAAVPRAHSRPWPEHNRCNKTTRFRSTPPRPEVDVLWRGQRAAGARRLLTEVMTAAPGAEAPLAPRVDPARPAFDNRHRPVVEHAADAGHRRRLSSRRETNISSSSAPLGGALVEKSRLIPRHWLGPARRAHCIQAEASHESPVGFGRTDRQARSHSARSRGSPTKQRLSV